MSPAVLAALPARGWDFGDFRYGLEPLVLPEPLRQGQRGGPPGRDFDADSADLLRELGALPSCRLEAAPADDPEQLFWFRWITGHQATFALWQCLARTLNDAQAEPDRRGPVDVMAQLIRAYTAMLLYTGSCPIDLYHEMIRPSMYLQHRGFSGAWAPDFSPLRRLLRGRPFPWADTPHGEALAREVQAYQDVHMGIAARLVPGGRSLLQETAAQTRLLHPEMRAVVYDNYFLTLRAPVGGAEVTRQLVRRLKAIALDVTDNGLYPGRDDAALPPELKTPAVVARERGFTDTVTGLAALVTGAV